MDADRLASRLDRKVHPAAVEEAIVDELSVILSSLRITGGIYCTADLRTPCGLLFDPQKRPVFHIVDEGRIWIGMEDERRVIELQGGDMVLLPRGNCHTLLDEPERRTVRFDQMAEVGGRIEDGCLYMGNQGPSARLLCGRFHIENEDINPFWTQLPPVLHLRGEEGKPPAWLRATTTLLAKEISAGRAGTHVMVNRLLEVLLVEVLRMWISDHKDAGPGWIRAMRDKQIAQAVALIHERPSESWTVASLASQVGMSRSVFAERFTELVGEAPLAYLTRWRMQVAATLLRGHEVPSMIHVAQRVGYATEPAFHRAFKRMLGVTPGDYRKQARSGAAGVQDAA